MITKLETLPNEIFLRIFSHLSWFDILMSLWSLNSRINCLVCSIFSINDYALNTNLLITLGLSYNKFSTSFLLILNSSSLLSSIKSMHIDETNLIASDLIHEWLFNDKKILHFTNLKSFILLQCQITEPVIQTLSYLIKYQLNELTLTFNKETTLNIDHGRGRSFMDLHRGKQVNLMKQLFYQLFSDECQLTYLRFNVTSSLCKHDFHQWSIPKRYIYSPSIQYQGQSCCISLRHLHIQLNCIRCLENLIEHVPNLEHMTVHFNNPLNSNLLWKFDFETLKQSNENWFTKVPKLRDFNLKILISEDLEFSYLKWLLNNINYVEKLQIYLINDALVQKRCQKIWKSSIDANFVRKYCLPEKITNLVDFNFYISSPCQLSFNDLDKIIDSFKIHSFFIDHQWTNVKCLFDPIKSLQHLFSSFINTRLFSDNRM